MEVGLLDLAVHQRDLLAHVAHPLDDAAECEALGRRRIDDLAADIPCNPDLVHSHPALGINADVGNRGEVAQMAEPSSNAIGRHMF